MLSRRAMLTFASLAAASAALPAYAQENEASHEKRMMEVPPDAPKVAMLIYPRMVALDLIGPMTVFNLLRCNIQLIWKNKNPVSTDVRIPFVASQTFDECPKDLDVLFVPGGIMGSVDCMNDPVVCEFLADRGSRAKWVTSVCTGGLVLGAAGLLKGYDATAAWTVADLLPLMGARHLDQRVVQDRNRLTGGGVTAGLDFGLTLARLLKNEEAAQRIQLILEYAPAPPFHSGTPAEAGPDRTEAVRRSRVWMDGQARLAAEAAARRLKIGKG